MTLSQSDKDTIAKMRIREIIELYFSGINEKHRDSIVRCFADETQIQMYSDTDSEATHTNGAAFADHLLRSVSKLDLATHTVSNSRIDLAGSTANTVTHVTSTHVRGDKTSTRGIRYVDEFVLNDVGWKIRKRQHWVLWQYDSPLTEVTRPAPKAASAKPARD